MRTVAFALLFLALPLAAQTPTDSLGFSDLEAEIRSTVVLGDIYFRQLDEAWDRAVVAGQFGRADSVAVLAETYIMETQGLPRDSVVWPSAPDRFALGLLAGDLWAVRWLADDGAWWDTPTTSPYPRTDVGYVSVPRLMIGPIPRYGLRFSVANRLRQDSSAVLDRLAASGATDEEQALARLALDKLLLQPPWGAGFIDTGFTPAQEALNERADAYLERYPGTRYGRFVREEVRLRYNVDGSVALYLGLGPGWATGNLGEATNPSIAGEIGIGVRYRWVHAGLNAHGSDLNVSETRIGANGTSLVESDRISVGLLGVEAGPRVALGGLDILPYLTGGVMLQGVSAKRTEDEPLSTYDPATRLSWGYGMALEYLGNREKRYGGTALRLRAGRVMPRFERGFETVIDGPITTVTFALTLTGILRERAN